MKHGDEIFVFVPKEEPITREKEKDKKKKKKKKRAESSDDNEEGVDLDWKTLFLISDHFHLTRINSAHRFYKLPFQNLFLITHALRSWETIKNDHQIKQKKKDVFPSLQSCWSHLINICSNKLHYVYTEMLRTTEALMGVAGNKMKN